ncbi:MAG: SCP2 sterol-binding domain-containing protein [Micromonosporaceae bacterium]
MRREWIRQLLRAANSQGSGRDRLARLLDELSDQQLDQLERGMWRKLLLGGLARGLPTRFSARRAGDLQARIEARFPHPDGLDPDRFEIQIADGRCLVRRGAAADPDMTCTITIADLLRLSRGSTNLMILWVRGDLKLDGDPYLMWKLPDLFAGPDAPR